MEIASQVIQVSDSAILQKPGEFFYTKSTHQWPNGAILIRCPKCNNPCSLPIKYSDKIKRYFTIIFYKLLNRKGEPLTIEPGVFCSYCEFKYKVNRGQIVPIEEN